MTLANTSLSYGLAARTLHWLTALLIFVAFPLGYIANNTELTDAAAVERVFALFSWHKTIGAMALFIGLARIVWSLFQPRPAPMPHAGWERALAALTHGLLTLALVAVPLTGWLAHSASPGLAPILLPLPQHLPAVPATAQSAAVLGGIHWVATKLLAIAIVLHIAGVLKHTFIDRDATLSRMTRGIPAPGAALRRETSAILAAVALWIGALALGTALGLSRPTQTLEPTRDLSQGEGHITVIGPDGAILGSASEFSFSLALDPDAASAEKGTLDVTIALDAMTGPGVDRILAAAPFPLLTYAGTITGDAPRLTADGVMDLAGSTERATLSVTIDTEGAVVTGTAPFPGADGLTLTIDIRARE